MTTQTSTAAALADAHTASEYAHQARNHADRARSLIVSAAAGMSTEPPQGEHIATAAEQLAILAASTAEQADTYAENMRRYPPADYTSRTRRATHRAQQLANAARHLANAAESVYLAAYYQEA